MEFHLFTIKNKSRFFALIFLFSILFTSSSTECAVALTTLFSKTDRLDLKSGGTNVMIARYLVANPDLDTAKLYFTFGDGCKIAHFTTGGTVLIQDVKIAINTTDTVSLYNRTSSGGDCNAVLLWQETGVPQDTYIIDVLVTWNPSVNETVLAGKYFETLDVIALP